MASNQWSSFPNDMFQFSAGQHSSRGQPGYTETPSMSLKRRAARILKVNSAGTSPHTIGRRKTTAVHGTARQRLTLDSVRHASEDTGYAGGRSRPISWHPSSFANSNSQSPAAIPRQEMSTMLQLPLETNFTTASVNGVVTPLSFPYPDEPLPSELFSTLDEYQGWAAETLFQGYQGMNGFSTAAGSIWPQQSMTTTPMTMGPIASTQMAHGVPYSTGPSQMYSQHAMPHFNVAQATVTTAPPTPDFLPIQTFSSETEGQPFPKEEPVKDELVGMGLYDAPDESPYPDSSLEEYLYLTRLDGRADAPVRPLGKGLKLEETFNPSTIEDDEDDEEEENEDQDAEYMSDESTQEVQKVETVRQSQPTVSAAAPNLSDHTFFFEHDERLSNRSNHVSNFQPGSQWGRMDGVPYGWL